MTDIEFDYYSNKAINLFNFMNGNINSLNSNCMLYIDRTHPSIISARIRYPNHITIFIENVYNCWNDRYILDGINKDDYITTIIAWALAHELCHADQEISLQKYNNDINYKSRIESGTERRSHAWVMAHNKELSQLTGSNIIISSLTSEYLLKKDYYYENPSIKEFYKQTVLNVIVKDEKFNIRYIDDDVYDDIVIAFNNIDSVVIKENKMFLRESIPKFSEMVYRYMGQYDEYSLKIRYSDTIYMNKHIGYIYFNTHSVYTLGMEYSS